MMNRTMWMVMIVVAALLMVGCSPKSRYDQKLKRELASGIRHDSLFLGMHFGMSDKNFYTLCWELNREGVIRQSNSNTSVIYDPGEKLKHSATMEFYPKFLNEKIVEMPVKFFYDGWAPWNKELSSAQLVDDIRNWFENEYGKGFISVTHPSRGKAFTKIDGNRRITIYQEDDLYAWAIFTDMSAESEEQANEKQANEEAADEESAE